MDGRAHGAGVESWRAQRNAALRREIGWLTLVGLGWLREGANRVGSEPDNEVVLPSGQARAGTVVVSNGTATATGDFTHAGKAARSLPLTSDTDGDATMLELGKLRLCLIERGGRLAIRTWDTTSRARRDFDGIDHWPVDGRWRVDARYDATPGRTLEVPDVLGTVDEQASPGEVVFELGSVIHRLQGLSGGESGELWLVFADGTNGAESYGGGRFLYTGVPDADGRVSVDFNRAYNPPCVFSPFATCPLPWPENRLNVRIEAGERMWSMADRRRT